jgi:chromosome segregation ATPase
MSPMSDQPVTLAVLTTALAQFHREIIRPDVQQIVGDAVANSERRMQANFDSILHKLDKLETEYEALKAGLGRVEEDQKRMSQTLKVLENQYRDLVAGFHRLEERLARVEKNVDELVAGSNKEPLRAEVADLRARVDSLQAQVRSLESRLEQRD